MNRRGLDWMVVGAVFAAIAVVLGVYYAPALSGDAVIHLSVMEQTARGGWFQFNPGSPEACSSSLLWTMLGAALWKLGGAPAAVYGIKALGYASWLALGALVYVGSVFAGGRRAAALVVALAFVASPGVAMNCLEGMENGLFAVFVLAACLLIARQLARPEPSTRGVATAFGALFLAAVTRPEGIAVAALLGALWFVDAWRRHRRSIVALSCVAIVAGVLPSCVCLAAYASVTGHWIPTSGVSRVMAARREAWSFALLGLWFYPAALVRLAVYAPLTGLALRTVRSVLAGPRGQPLASIAKAVGAAAATGLVVYSVGTGASQTSRYLIWVFALLGVLAAASLGSNGERLAPLRRPILVIATVWMLVLYGGEAYARVTTRGFHHAADIVAAPARRTAHTDTLLRNVCRFGCCATTRPPTIGAFEVQVRFFYDSRVSIASMDGVTSGPRGQPVDFDERGCPALQQLLDDPNVVALVDNPSLNLAQCLPPGPMQAIANGWGRPGSVGNGWVWDQREYGMIRDCRREQPTPRNPLDVEH